MSLEDLPTLKLRSSAFFFIVLFSLVVYYDWSGKRNNSKELQELSSSDTKKKWTYSKEKHELLSCPPESCFGESNDHLKVRPFKENLKKLESQSKCLYAFMLGEKERECKRICNTLETKLSPTLAALKPSGKFLHWKTDLSASQAHKKYDNEGKNGYCDKKGMWNVHHRQHISSRLFIRVYLSHARVSRRYVG